MGGVFDNLLMTLALGGLAVSGLLFASAWLYPYLCRAWDKATALARAAFCGAVVVACLFGGAKHKVGGITYPRTDSNIAYLTDAGSYVTNDAVHVSFTRVPTVPDSAAFYLDYCALDGTNEQGVATNWVNAKTATFADLSVPFDFAFAFATNYNWVAYTDWTPGPAVQTNGVWHAYWGIDRKEGRYFIPVRTCVRDGGEVIATPKSKWDVDLPYAYVKDGLIAFYDVARPNDTFCDTTYLLKPEGTDSYECPHTVEFVATRKTDNEWYAIKWNTASYPFLPRLQGGYWPNAHANGNNNPFTWNLRRWNVGETLAVVVTADGDGNMTLIFNGSKRHSAIQNKNYTCKQAVYPEMFSDPSGYVHSYRLYNRVLTDAELAHNAEIDRARFGTGE